MLHDTGYLDDLKLFFVAAKALECLCFTNHVGCGECKFLSAAVAGLVEGHERCEEILMSDSGF